MTKTAAICTMGCKVNSYESQGMIELLEQDGYTIVDFEAPADVYIINTCTVTQIAARKSRQMIHRARNLSPNALVIAAGCYVDRDDSLIQEGIIDLAIPNRRKAKILEYIHNYRNGLPEPAEDEIESPEAAGEKSLYITRSEGKTRAFLKVQDGCRQFCSYCIIPFVRGPLYSRPIKECVEEAKELSKAGFHEIVLTGIHASSYGRDLKEKAAKLPEEERNNLVIPDLGDLILAIAQVEGVERIRLSSLEPRLITEAFLEKVGQTKKLCPHFHLSLQSGCDTTLKAMNRKYTAAEFRHAVDLLRKAYPEVAVTTDIIVGFPGETDEDHHKSLEFARSIGFAEAHIFRYSPMKGTVAERRTDQIDGNIKKKRSEEMLEVTRESTLRFMESMQERTFDVLLEEKDEDGYYTGYTPNYLRVAVKEFEGAHPGLTVPVAINGYIEKRSANHDASGVEKILKGEKDDG